MYYTCQYNMCTVQNIDLTEIVGSTYDKWWKHTTQYLAMDIL